MSDRRFFLSGLAGLPLIGGATDGVDATEVPVNVVETCGVTYRHLSATLVSREARDEVYHRYVRYLGARAPDRGRRHRLVATDHRVGAWRSAVQQRLSRLQVEYAKL